MAVLSYCSPACGGGKIYAKNLIAAVFVVCQLDNHILEASARNIKISRKLFPYE